MRCDKKDLLLYGVTDRSWLGDRTLAQQVEASLRGGATMIQLREKHMDRGSILAQALELRELCGRYGVPLILNDDAELAQAAGADGVHVGQSDMESGPCWGKTNSSACPHARWSRPWPPRRRGPTTWG